MTRLVWTTAKSIRVSPYEIPCVDNLADQGRWKAGIRWEPKRKRFLKSAIWHAAKLRDDLLVDGFLEWVTGGWIRESAQSNTTFLEIGCGDMSLSRYLPRDVCYNAFDLSLSEFHLRRLLNHRPNANLAIASVTDIPLDSNSATLIACTQVVEYVGDIDRALSEIHRVSAPRGRLVCTIANGHSYKYKFKGVHHGHVNRWAFRDFIDLMEKHGFRILDCQMRGLFVPLPSRLARSSYALPISSRRESHNTHFLFLFETEK